MSERASVGLLASATYLGLAAFVAVLWFATLPSRPLFNPDEGRYAEIPREMLSGGDWVIPHLNGVAYIEKPPLQYWATAISLRVFGQNELAARLYTALCALATLVLVWRVAEGLWGGAAAWRAAAVLSSLLLFVVLGQLLTLDMSLTFYMTLALAGFLLAQETPQPEGASQLQRALQPQGTPQAERASQSQPAPQPQSGSQSQSQSDSQPESPSQPESQPQRDSQTQPRLPSQRAPRASGAERHWMLVAWAATALGVLTKGLVAAAIPAAVLVLYSLYSRDFVPWRRLDVARGLPLFLAIAVPWHWLAARRVPDFLRFFFMHEHLSRYLTPSADREEVWWFFAAVFALGSIPWTLSAVRIVVSGWQRRAPRGQFDPALFLWIWVVFVCVFFSFSDSKLIPYILPAMPAVALLIAASPTASLSRDVGFTAVFTLLAGVALAAATIYGPRLVASTARNEYFLTLAGPLAQIAALLAISGMFVLFQRRRDVTRAAVLLGVGWCLAGMLLMRAAGAVAPVYSGIVLARALGAIPRDEPIYSVATYDQTLAFYSQRTVKLVAYRGELDFGLGLDPSAEIPTVAEFIGEWQNVPEGYAVMEMAMFEDLKNHGVPMRKVARDVHRILVARR